MLEKCTLGGSALMPGNDQWLCPWHLHARAHAAGLCSSTVTVAREATMLRALVFDFPAECCRGEFIARVHYAINILGSHTRVTDLSARHGVNVRASHRLNRGERRDLVFSLFEFVRRNAHVSQSLVASCARRVCSWYPDLICTDSLESVMKSERVIRAVERATGARDFLVLSDIARALSGVFCRELLEKVYLCYARQLRRPPWGEDVIFGAAPKKNAVSVEPK